MTIQAYHNPNRIEAFYSYSREDERFRYKLEKHLSLLVRQHIIAGWHDRLISSGDDWRNRISDRLETARLVLLLVSSDFLASDYCYDIEMKRALERHEAGEAVVIPLILRPCEWKLAPFGKLASLPKDGRPVTQWSTHDAAFFDIATGVRSALVDRGLVDSSFDEFNEPNRQDAIPGSADPRQEGWTDREVVVLSPLWATDEPLAQAELMSRLEHHPVRYCRPQLNIMGNLHYHYALFCYSRYCAREFLRLTPIDIPKANRWREAGMRYWKLSEPAGFAKHPAF